MVIRSILPVALNSVVKNVCRSLTSLYSFGKICAHVTKLSPSNQKPEQVVVYSVVVSEDSMYSLPESGDANSAAAVIAYASIRSAKLAT